MYKLFTGPGTCALASHIVLEELGLPYEAVRVDFASQAQRSPEYLAINPKGRVPALVTPRGVLTETPAHDLEITTQNLDEAFLALTSDDSTGAGR